MIITLLNPTTDDLEKTYLSTSVAAGVTALPVKNNDRFTTNDRIMIGELGQEKTEIVTWQGNTGNTFITTTATVYPHSADDPVYKLQFDQVKFYRSTGGISGTYSVISTQALDVDNENLTTIYDDTSGLAGYYYKMTVYHSLLSIESSFSDPIAGSGNARNSVGVILDELFEELGDDAQNNVSRSEMIAWMNEMHDDLHSRAQKPWNFLLTRETFDKTANARTLDAPTFDDGSPKMWKFKKLIYNFTDNTTSPVTDLNEPIRSIYIDEFDYLYQDNTVDSTTVNDTLRTLAYDEAAGVFRYGPPSETTVADAFILVYWRYLAQLSNDGDIVETPGTKIYKDFIRMKYNRKLAKKESSYLRIADKFETDYERDIYNLQKFNRRDMGRPRSFEFRGGKTYKGFRVY